MKVLSSRFHLAVGLTSMVVTLLLLASFAGLVPDRDAAVRAGRATLAESIAVSSSVLLSDDDDRRLEQVLRFVVKRNPDLQSIAVRERSGQVRLHVGAPIATDEPIQSTSTDTLLRVPLLQDGLPWGQAELRYEPILAGGWWNAIGSTALLVGAVGLGCFVLFYLYLRRMLRHLDPARVIPGRVRTAFDTLAEGLLVLDPAGRIVLANRAFAEVVGGEADKLVGRKAESLDWSFPSTSEADATPWAAMAGDGQPRRNVLMYLTDQEGKRRSFMVNGSPVPGAGGKPAGMLVSLDDVTTLEEQEIQLRLARDQAEQANRAKSDFLANMSHEIRTPMNAILGFAELLRRGWQQDSRDAHRHLDIILGSGRHLLALINDILDLSKIEAGKLEVERLPCAVHDVVQEVVTILRVKAEEKGLSLAVDFPQAMPATVLSDASRVRQIVTNLVGNALKFTPAGGRVTVTVRLALDRTPTQIAIDVSDTGIGIPSDRLDAIFDPFVQAEASTTRQYGGTGLGLAISRRFARALGGDIVATSDLGQGSTFHITLDPGPLDDVAWIAPESLAVVHRRDRSTVRTRWVFEPKRVLVVDDGPENRELVRLVLENCGLVVLEAENGQIALDMVQREAPDLVLMDVQMPVMNGYVATRTLRERGCTLPVLALTGNAMKGFEREVEEAGFTGYLTKPVDIDALMAALAHRLGGRTVEETVIAQSPADDASAPSAAAVRPVERTPVVSRLASHPRLGRVVRNFGRSLPLKLQEMRAALDARRFEDLAALAHWLKGAGGTVGFDDFFEPARKLEEHAKAGRLPELEQELRTLQSLSERMVIPEEDAATAA
jgi:PAS domain S-box-containing protein